jgi:hypothetical protein
MPNRTGSFLDEGRGQPSDSTMFATAAATIADLAANGRVHTARSCGNTADGLGTDASDRYQAGGGFTECNDATDGWSAVGAVAGPACGVRLVVARVPAAPHESFESGNGSDRRPRFHGDRDSRPVGTGRVPLMSTGRSPPRGVCCPAWSSWPGCCIHRVRGATGRGPARPLVR